MHSSTSHGVVANECEKISYHCKICDLESVHIYLATLSPLIYKI